MLPLPARFQRLRPILFGIGVLVLVGLPWLMLHRAENRHHHLTISTGQMTGEVQYGFEEVEEIFGIELGGDRDANVVAVASVETALLSRLL